MTASSELPAARVSTGWILVGLGTALVCWSALSPHLEHALSMGQLQLLLALGCATSLFTAVLALTLCHASGAAPLGWLAGGTLAATLVQFTAMLVATGDVGTPAHADARLAWLWWIERLFMAIALLQFARHFRRDTHSQSLTWLGASLGACALILAIGQHIPYQVNALVARPWEMLPGILFGIALLWLLNTGNRLPSAFLIPLLIGLLLHLWLQLGIIPFTRDLLDGFARDSLVLRVLAQALLFLALSLWLAHYLRQQALSSSTATTTPIASKPVAPPAEPSPAMSRKVLLSLMEDFHRAREQAVEAKQFAESIIDNLPLMVFVKEAKELRFQRLNKAGEELLGLSSKEVLGKSDHDFFPPEQADFFIRTDQAVLRGDGVVDVVEEPIETSQGTRWLHTRKIPVKNARGVPLYLLGIAEDITERRRFIQQLEQTNRYKTRFLANMSHELRTPMNSIIGFTDKVLKRAGPQLGERHQDALETVLRNARHLLGLINDMLDLSKIESGKMDVEIETFDLRLTLELLRAEYTQMAQAKGLHFTLGLPMEPLTITTDRRKLIQVCHNLISNAIKYTEHGTVTVSASEELHSELGAAICLRVHDTGIGMLPEDQQKLFTEFSRASEVRQKGIAGTGLGLLISAQLTALLGGRIQADSVHGQGSTFTVWLPVEKT